MLCVFSTMRCAFLCLLIRPHHFVVARVVCRTCLSVHAFLCKFITVERRILNRVASQQISPRRKQSAARERQTQHGDVRRLSLKATTHNASDIRFKTRPFNRKNSLVGGKTAPASRILILGPELQMLRWVLRPH